MNRANILATLLMTVIGALPAMAQYDSAAKHFHLLPHLADGGGWRSSLLVTNVSRSESVCRLELYGLTLDRFQDADAVTAEGSTATFELPGSGGHLGWDTRGESTLASGYAVLGCTKPVVAQVVFSSIGSSGAVTGMATVFSSQPGGDFQFPVLTPAATLGFAIANDTEHHDPVDCRIVLQDPQGMMLGEAELRVPSKTNHVESLHRIMPIPGGFTRGSARVSCGGQVAMIGLHFELEPDGSIITFNTLPGAILSRSSDRGQSWNFDGLWGPDSLVITRAIMPPAWQQAYGSDDNCTGVADCGGDYYPRVKADLTQDGQAVTGSVSVTTSQTDWIFTVEGSVSADGTLSLTSDNQVPLGQGVSIRLASLETRMDAPGGIMKGTGALHLSSDNLPGTFVSEFCLGSEELASSLSYDRLPPCTGWTRQVEE